MVSIEKQVHTYLVHRIFFFFFAKSVYQTIDIYLYRNKMSM